MLIWILLENLIKSWLPTWPVKPTVYLDNTWKLGYQYYICFNRAIFLLGKFLDLSKSNNLFFKRQSYVSLSMIWDFRL